MALGRRCDLGCETWPDDDKFKVCPECGEKTKRYKGVNPITDEEAVPYLFEAFYQEWDEKMPETRLQMTPEEHLRWDALFPNGRPFPVPPKGN